MALLRSYRTLLPSLSQQLQRLEAEAIGIRASSSSSSSSSNTSNVPAKQPELLEQPEPEQRKSAKPSVEDDWTEVIDEKSGQPYYWNQKTGETTELGEPRPKTKFKNSDWQQAAASGPFQDGWREPPGRDLTYFYSMLGAGIGIAVGWATQYTH